MFAWSVTSGNGEIDGRDQMGAGRLTEVELLWLGLRHVMWLAHLIWNCNDKPCPNLDPEACFLIVSHPLQTSCRTA